MELHEGTGSGGFSRFRGEVPQGLGSFFHPSEAGLPSSQYTHKDVCVYMPFVIDQAPPHKRFGHPAASRKVQGWSCGILPCCQAASSNADRGRGIPRGPKAIQTTPVKASGLELCAFNQLRLTLWHHGPLVWATWLSKSLLRQEYAYSLTLSLYIYITLYIYMYTYTRPPNSYYPHTLRAEMCEHSSDS